MFKKYAIAEKVETVSKEASDKIRGIVKQAGKKSASELTEEQRKDL